MSPTKPSARSRAAGETRSDMPKTAKPRAARKTKPAAGKTAKPRAPKAAKARAAEAERQLELIASPAPQTQPRPVPAPVRPQAAAVPRPIAPAPEPEERRRGWLLLLIPLLMLGSFWIGRVTSTRTIEVAPAPAPASSIPAATASTPSQVVATAPQTTAQTKPAVTNASGRRGPDTSLVEVSVGTTSRGGLTLRFDHPVAWQMNAAGMGDGELDVQGVRALGTFPRNLPLPPGVTSIRAGISAETLKLGFGLQPGVRVYTVPGTGPATALNIYFRTPAEETAALAESGAGACGASASPQAVKAVLLLQQSLDKNPGYAAVRQTLALLETCAGDGAKAEQLLAATGKDGGNGVKLTVTDVALRYARGDIDGALKALKDGMPAGDAGYQELLADLEAARQP